MDSALERTFDTYWRMVDGPELTPEHRFAAEIVGTGPGLRARLDAAGLADWRFDRAHLRSQVAIELDGGTWGKRNKDGERVPGRHTRGKGFAEDCRKINAAQLAGWLVFRFTTDMLSADPVGCLAPVVEMMREREYEARIAAETWD